MDDKATIEFYNEYRDGLPTVVVTLFVIRAVISIVGIALNLLLIVTTFMNKNLHGPCNWLLALDSAFSVLFQLSAWATVGVLASGSRFITLDTCFWLNVVSVAGTTLLFQTMFYISIERLCAVLFPKASSSGRRSPIYIAAALANSTLALVIVMYLLRTQSIVGEERNLMVMCTLTDLYRGSGGNTSFGGTLLTIIVTLLMYAAVWVSLRRAFAKSALTGSTLTTSSRSNDVTTQQRIFKSLSVILCLVIIGWFFDICSHFFLAKLGLSPLDQVITMQVLSCAANVTASGNMPTLYFCSKEYHQALRRSLGRLHAFLFQQPTGMTRTVVPPVMTVNNNNNNNNISGGQPTRCSQHQSLQVGHGCPVRRHQRRSVFFFETSTLPPRIPPSGFRSARGISPVAQTPSNLLTDTITATNNPNTAKLRF